MWKGLQSFDQISRTVKMGKKKFWREKSKNFLEMMKDRSGFRKLNLPQENTQAESEEHWKQRF